MNHLLRTEAIVIKKKNYRETDQLITFFTKRLGKIIALAKGVRQLKSKRAPSLDLFNHIVIYLYRKKDFFTLTEVKLLNGFDEIKDNLASISSTFQAIELLDKLLAVEQDHPPLFTKTLGLFGLLEDNFDHKDTLTTFKKELLVELGFGHPVKLDSQSLNDYIETIIQQRLVAVDFLAS